jgi:hypothetical protein
MVLASDLPPGTQVQCPGCGQIVVVPALGAAGAPVAASGEQALKSPLIYIGIGVGVVVLVLVVVVIVLMRGGQRQAEPVAQAPASGVAVPAGGQPPAVPGQPEAPTAPAQAAQPTPEQLAAETAEQARQLCAKLGSDEYAERSDAKDALIKMRRSAVPGLVATLQSGNVKARAAAAEALGEIGESGAMEALKDGLRDGEPKVRQACADALGAMRERSAVDALIAALTDSDMNVRYKLKDTLERLTDNSFPDADPKLENEPPAYQRLWSDWWAKNRVRLMAEQDKAANAKAEEDKLREVVPVHIHPHTHSNGVTHTHPHEATEGAHHGTHVGVDPKTIKQMQPMTRMELQRQEEFWLKEQADAEKKGGQAALKGQAPAASKQTAAPSPAAAAPKQAAPSAPAPAAPALPAPPALPPPPPAPK